MDDRIHFTIDGDDKDRLRALAEDEGISLSEWMRRAAAERAEEPGDEGDARRSPPRSGREGHREIIERLMESRRYQPQTPEWLPSFARRFYRRQLRRWKRRRD